jgi:Ni/Co efflux regulator RcnB
MKRTITAVLALVLLAGTASAALAQDEGGHHGGRRDGGAADGRGQNGDQGPQFRDTERRDMMGGADNRGQRRSEFQAAQTPVAPPQAREAPTAQVAPQAPQGHGRGQYRGGDGQAQPQGQPQGQFRANRDVAGRQQDAARQHDYNRRGDPTGGQVVVMPPRPDSGAGGGQRYGGRQPDGRPEVNGGGTGSRDGRRWDGDRNGGNLYSGDRNGGNRNGGNLYSGDRRDWDHNGARNDHRDWNRNDDRGRPHWQQGRYPSVYRSQHRYRYAGYYRPPIGFYAFNWSFGDFLPQGWYGPDYLLYDWWNYDLPYPPPGYDWVRVGDDALLVDSYTGRVVQVVRLLFW